MKYPDLVLKSVCKVPCKVKIYGEKLDKDGAPVTLLESNLLCNFQDRAKTIFTDQKKAVLITGTAFFNGDVAPDISNFVDGEFEVFGKVRRIIQGSKARNLDGTVNYTQLEVQ